jgi:hypothetical protein
MEEMEARDMAKRRACIEFGKEEKRPAELAFS